MESRLSTLERAYQLAAAGDCAGITDIKKRLAAEGYATSPNSFTGVRCTGRSASSATTPAGGKPGPERLPFAGAVGWNLRAPHELSKEQEAPYGQPEAEH